MKKKKYAREEIVMKTGCAEKSKETTACFLPPYYYLAPVNRETPEDFLESVEDDESSTPLLLTCPACGTDNIHVEVTENLVLIITCRECGSQTRFEE